MKRNIKKLKLLAQCQNDSHHKNYKSNSNFSNQSDSIEDVNI